MDFKFDMFLEFGSSSATETVYKSAANWDAIPKLADTLASWRATLFPQQVKLKMVRVSDVDFKRDSKVFVSDKWAGKKFINEECDHAFATQYVRLNSTNKYWRAYHLSGIPDGLHTGILLDSPIKPAWDKQLQLYLDYLVEAEYSIRALDRETVGAPKVIQSIGNPDANNQILITAPNHGFANQDKVRISGAKGNNADMANGIKTVFAVDANTFKVPGVNPELLIEYTGGGIVAARKKLLKPITDCVPLALRSRQRRSSGFLRQQGSRRRKK